MNHFAKLGFAFAFGTFCLSSYCQADDEFTVARGQLTFDAEGQEGGSYHSRKPHVPSDSSGVTIGRGYDMKHRTETSIAKDLENAGLSETEAKAYAGAAGFSGETARMYVTTNAAKLVEITPAQQKKLFGTTYAEIEKDVKRICGKADVIEAYGTTDWDKLDAKIGDVLVDLRFRGDYTPASRRLIQKHVADNKLVDFRKVIVEKTNWPNVPKDRFDRRVKFIGTDS